MTFIARGEKDDVDPADVTRTSSCRTASRGPPSSSSCPGDALPAEDEAKASGPSRRDPRGRRRVKGGRTAGSQRHRLPSNGGRDTTRAGERHEEGVWQDGMLGGSSSPRCSPAAGAGPAAVVTGYTTQGALMGEPTKGLPWQDPEGRHRHRRRRHGCCGTTRRRGRRLGVSSATSSDASTSSSRSRANNSDVGAVAGACLFERRTAAGCGTRARLSPRIPSAMIFLWTELGTATCSTRATTRSTWCSTARRECYENASRGPGQERSDQRRQLPRGRGTSLSTVEGCCWVVTTP